MAEWRFLWRMLPDCVLGGGAIYQGQWVQIQMQGAAGLHSNGYWNLVYDVAPAATAGDTFSVEVGFNGTPDHLLP